MYLTKPLIFKALLTYLTIKHFLTFCFLNIWLAYLRNENLNLKTELTNERNNFDKVTQPLYCLQNSKLRIEVIEVIYQDPKCRNQNGG